MLAVIRMFLADGVKQSMLLWLIAHMQSLIVFSEIMTFSTVTLSAPDTRIAPEPPPVEYMPARRITLRWM